MGAEDPPLAQSAAMPATAAGVPPVAAAIPVAIPTAQPAPVPVMAAQPQQENCAVNCMQITSMVIGILNFIGAGLSVIDRNGPNWWGLVFGLLIGVMLVTATSMWVCSCCGDKRQNGRVILGLLFASTLLYLIGTIAGFVLISQTLKCESWRDDPPEAVKREFEKRDDYGEDWDEWMDGAEDWCKVTRSIGYAINGIGLIFTGLVGGTAFLTYNQLKEWSRM